MLSLTSRLALAAAIAAAALTGCKGDPSTPAYWEKQVSGARRTQDKVRVFEDLRASGKANKDFLPFLHERLKDEKKPETRAVVAKVLGDLKDPSSVLPLSDKVDMVGSDADTTKMNKAIAEALAQIGSPAGVPTLLRMLKAKDGFVQIEAITALGKMRAKEAVVPLMDKAKDDESEPLIIRKAILALGEIGDARALPVLIQGMFRSHPRRGEQFYGESSFALYQVGQPAADALVPVLRGDDQQLKAWAKSQGVFEAALYSKAAQVLGDLHDRRAEPDLIKQLTIKGDPEQQVFVRLTCADALGKLRSKAAVKPLAALMANEEPVERTEYGWALARIGSRDAAPALVKAAGIGIWVTREPAISTLAMVGDERDRAALDKLRADEAGRTQKECGEEPDLPGCRDAKGAADTRQKQIADWGKALDASKECGSDAACWGKKLEDKTAAVRQRAALEIGRAGGASLLPALMQRFSDENLEVRRASVQAVDWILDQSPDAMKQAQAALDQIDKQLEADRGKTDYAKSIEDLKRLAARLRRSKPA